MIVLLLIAFCLFLELRKYQKLLEPPPSAKPITVDVDRKLEDGQKVTPSLLPARNTLQGQGSCQFNSVWSCCFQIFKQMAEIEMGMKTFTRDVEGSVVWGPSVPSSNGIPPQSCMSELPWGGFACTAMSKLALMLNLFSCRMSDCCVQNYRNLGNLFSLQKERAATAQAQGNFEKSSVHVMTFWLDR